MKNTNQQNTCIVIRINKCIKIIAKEHRWSFNLVSNNTNKYIVLNVIENSC